MSLAAGSHLGRYQIHSLLGAGGMGEVYLARDELLGRNVALKLLPPEMAAHRDRLQRFEREARAASALNHPNILTVHEIGEAEGAHYIVSEHVDGETLRKRMLRSPLELQEALGIAAQVAAALAVAHEAGIIHRDIKPENVMLRPDRLVKVLDFGLAKLVDRKSDELIDQDEETVAMLRTEAGTVMGTVSYMSPEQARGAEVDARSDLWSLAVMLYEMVAGRPPFTGPTASHVMVSILESEPPPVSKFRPDAPQELLRLLNKALSKDRLARYQTARDLMIDLENLIRDVAGGAKAPLSIKRTPSRWRARGIALAAVVIAIAAAITAALLLRDGGPDAADVASIAVLPFANSGSDPDTEYLAEGMSESLINSLSMLNMSVKARGVVSRYRGIEVDPGRVGEELGVAAVLLGRVHQRGEELTISVELVDTRTGNALWGERYVKRLADLVAIQEELTRDVAGKLRSRLSGENLRRIGDHGTRNSEAFQLYLRGRYYWNEYDEAGFRKAIEYHRRATQLDPDFALAWAGLAESWALLGVDHIDPRQALPQAITYAGKALALDESLAEAHNALAIARLFYEWDRSGAEASFLRAIALRPDYADARHFYGHYLQAVGRLEESIVETKKGVALDPDSLILNTELGFAYYIARDYDRAIAQYRRTLEHDPHFVFARWCLAGSYLQKKMFADAIRELETARPLAGDWPYIDAELASTFAASGRREEALKIAGQLQDRAASQHVDPTLIAFIHIELRDRDEAIRWLQQAYEDRSIFMTWIATEPRFDWLRDDPRFQQIERLVAGGPPA
jgi:eukaryotic-like serine/threonine-protein kinase